MGVEMKADYSSKGADDLFGKIKHIKKIFLIRLYIAQSIVPIIYLPDKTT